MGYLACIYWCKDSIKMRSAKHRKHDKVRASKQRKAYTKDHSLTSQSTKNRRARVVMDSEDITYTIIDGIVCT